MWLFSAINALLGLGVLDMMRHKDFWAGILGAVYFFAGALYPHTREVFPAWLALAGKTFSFLVVAVSVPLIYAHIGPQAALVMGGIIALVSLVWWPEVVEALLPRKRKPMQAARESERTVEGRYAVDNTPKVSLAEAEKAVRSRVIGQEAAIEAVFRGLRRKEAGLTRVGKPFSALLLGPTGTGKTELAKALAEALGRPLIRYDMNQYGQDHTVAALVGSPPGYVGSDQPGRVYTDLLANPRAVVLFDEMEKAHPRVLDPLLQLLDEGRFQELSKGLVANAPESILLFTTNLMAEEAFLGKTGEGSLREQLILKGMRPEWVNRLDVVAVFAGFDEAALARLARLSLQKYLAGWKARQGIAEVRADEDGLIPLILSRVDARFGARDVQRAVEEVVADPLAQTYLEAGGRARRVEITVEAGVVVVRIEGA